MKKLLIFLGLLLPAAAFAVAPVSYVPNLNPMLNSTFWLGTTTPGTLSWKGIVTDQLCLTADTCRTTWPTGGGGGGGSGNIATSTTETSGYWPYWTSTAGTPATLGATSTPYFSAFNFGSATGNNILLSNGSASLNINQNSNINLFDTASGNETFITQGGTRRIGVDFQGTVKLNSTTVVDSSGNLGIGITPTVPLTAFKAVGGQIGLFTNSNFGDLVIDSQSSPTNRYRIYTDNSNPDIELFTSGGNILIDPGGTGKVGIGVPAVTPTQMLTVAGNAIVTSTSNYFGVVDSTHGAIQDRKLSLDDGTFVGAGITQTTGCTISSNGFCFFSTRGYDFQTGGGDHVLNVTPSGGIGIGTTTPQWPLQISSSTKPQLTLSDGGANHWSFRSAGGFLYLATSSATTYATSTSNVLSVDANGLITEPNITGTLINGFNLSTCTSASSAVTWSAGQFGCHTIAGGGGSGGGTWATSTIGQYFVNYPLNSTDVVVIGAQATGTSKFYFDPNISLANILGTASTTNLFVQGSSTLQNFTGVNATTTNATSSNFAVTNLTANQLVASNALGGLVSTSTIGNNQLTNSSITVNGTSITLGGSQTITAASSTLLSNNNNFTGGNVFGNATSTNFYVSGNASTSALYLATAPCSGANALNVSSTGKVTCGALAPTAASVTSGAALTKTDDTNVTLTLGGSPSTALLGATSLTLGWTGTLADARITSAATWNAKESALTFNWPLTRTTNTISFSGLATTSPWTNGQVAYVNSSNLLTSTATSSLVQSTGINISNGTTAYVIGSQPTFTIDQTFTPTWTGAHIFRNTSNSASELTIQDSGSLPIFVANSLNRNVGIGTSTPRWALQIASSTGGQLTLSDGSLTSNHWTFRNAGGNFYLATSSPTTFATSSISALSITAGGVSGFVGIGTSTPNAPLHIYGAQARKVTTTNTSYTIATTSDNIIGVTSTASARTITLPYCTDQATLSTRDLNYTIKDQSGGATAHNITLQTVGANNIDGASTAVININYQAMNIYCDGSNWFIY